MVCVVISRLADTRRPTAPRLKALTPASTPITRAEARKILELSRRPGLSPLPRGSVHQSARQRGSPYFHRACSLLSRLTSRRTRWGHGVPDIRPDPSMAGIWGKIDTGNRGPGKSVLSEFLQQSELVSLEANGCSQANHHVVLSAISAGRRDTVTGKEDWTAKLEAGDVGRHCLENDRFGQRLARLASARHRRSH
jgi:hypothetical protein